MSQNRQISQNFRLNARNLILTYPRHPGTPEELMTFLQSKLKNINYIVVVQEIHLELDELAEPNHLHSFVQTQKKWDIQNPRYLDFQGKHGDYRVAIDPAKAALYCGDPSKEGYIRHISDGVFIDPKQKKKDKELEHYQKVKERNALFLTSNPKLLVDEGQLNLLELPKLIKSIEAYKNLEMPPKIINRECIWIQGDPGVGKSYYVRQSHDDLYEKNMTKWWDGYVSQDVVLVDDWELTPNKELSHFIKIWADVYRFSGENKGGMVFPRYTKFYVTSNYMPNQIWDSSEDSSLFFAIQRRFIIKQITIENGIRYIETIKDKGVDIYGDKKEINNN